MIIVQTPVRVSLFGGGTDYPVYYDRHPGAVLGTTITKYIYVSLNELSNFFSHRYRISYSKAETAQSASEIEHPSIRECLKHFPHDKSLDIHIFSDLPAKTGLGSSSAFTVGFINALYALQEKRVSKQFLADKACYVEQKLIKENVGSQDQYHTAFGGLNVIEFNRNDSIVKPILISQEKLNYLSQCSMLFFTGISRYATEVLKEQVQKTQSHSNDAFLSEMYESVFQAEKILYDCPPDKMISELGALLKQNWELKKKLSSSVSNETIDEYYQKAVQAGAYGGKICGAGTGGFLYFLVHPDKQKKVREALSHLIEVEFNIDSFGSNVIFYKK